MASALIVPINLEALCVGTDDVNGDATNPNGTKDFAEIAADFSRMPYLTQDPQGNTTAVNPGANISEAVLPAFFQQTGTPLQPGIHLHWTLPDALAHGVTDEDGLVRFRAAPDRWFVMRIVTNHTQPDALISMQKAWIVESNLLWDAAESSSADSGQEPATNDLSRAVPLNPPPDPSHVPNKPFMRMGRVFPYETWSEAGGNTYAAPHTALGYGEISFAAAYPHAPNVFGLYDPLDDLDLGVFVPAETRISYLVAGWYSSATNDPLSSVMYKLNASPQDVVAAIQAALRWTYTPNANGDTPDQTICSGLLWDITWDPQQRYIQAPSGAPVDVAVGNTTSEALSALLAKRPDLTQLDQVEQVLNALQLGLLSRLTQPDGLMQMEELLHQTAFGIARAGTLWVIKPKTPGNANGDQPVQVSGQDLLDAADQIQGSLPDALAHDLNLLNALQQQYDQAQADIIAAQNQLFADWYRYMVLQYPGEAPPTNLMTADDAFTYLNGKLTNSDSDFNTLINSTLPNLKAQIQQQMDKVNGELGDQFLLMPIASPRYWHANDPVILLSGSDLQPTYRPKDAASYDEQGDLICRLTSALISSMTVHSAPYMVQAGNRPPLPKSPNQTHLLELSALFGEAFFLDPNQAWLLAQAAAGKSAGNLWQAIQLAQKSLFTTPSTDITFAGTVPAPLQVQQWKAPWTPLLMEWEVYYYPVQTVDDDPNDSAQYSADFITTGFRLDNSAIDLIDPQAAPNPLPAVQIYRGVALLTHSAEINLQGQIHTYLKDDPDDPHAGELQAIRSSLDFSMMAQAMGGFHAALMMRKQTLQLPISDPLAVFESGVQRYVFTNTTVKNAVTDQTISAPLPNNSYNPLRAGFMRISKIWLVSTFGQMREITPKSADVARAESLTPVVDDPLNPFITLPARLVQPSRLLFRWLSAADDQVEMNSHPATTPIFGWVLFNHIDSSLAIYDADGSGLGSFNLFGPLWQGAPGDNATYDQPIETVFANANPHLRSFALGIYHHAQAVDFLRDLLDATDRALSLILPTNADQFQGISLLVGRPLALVRASLRLDLQGLPALNQSWTAFADAAKNNLPDAQRDTAAFPSVRFPVRLGDLAQMNDGLIGYFIDDGTDNAYQTFYAPASAAQMHGVIPPQPDQITLQADRNTADVVLSMMIDPRAPVHATMGILPVKQIQIPPDMYADVLKRMAITFLTAPVVSSAAQLAVPIPPERGFAWSWLSLDPDANQWEGAAIAQVNLGGDDFTTQQISEGWLKLSKADPDQTKHDKPDKTE